MQEPVIQSHLIGSSGLYGAPIGAPGIPLMMGIQVSEQNGVHIITKPPIPPIHAVKGSANPELQVDRVRKRRKLFPGLVADMQMASIMPQPLGNMSTPYNPMVGTIIVPPVPMVSNMGMPMGAHFNSNSIMPAVLPNDAMFMPGMSRGFGPGPQVPNIGMDNSMAALGLGLMQGSNRGSFPPQPPIMISDQNLMPNSQFHGYYQNDPHNEAVVGQTLYPQDTRMQDTTINDTRMQDTRMSNPRMGNSLQRSYNHEQIPQHPDEYMQENPNRLPSYSPRSSNVMVRQNQGPTMINQAPTPPPVIIVQQPPAMPVAAPIVGQGGGLIDKIGLVAGMVMAQKGSNRSKNIQSIQLAQLNEIKSEHDLNKSMMQDIKLERTFMQQDRTRMMQSGMGDPSIMGTSMRGSRMLPANILQTTVAPGVGVAPSIGVGYQQSGYQHGMNIDLSRISVATTQETIQLIVFPKVRPQIFSNKPVL